MFGMILFGLVGIGFAWAFGHFLRQLYQAAALNHERELIAQKRPGDLDGYPHVTVIIPARNEERNIGACLGAVLASDYPRLEVVVANDGSTDGTEEIVRGVASRDARVRIVSPPAGPEARRGWVSGKSFVVFNAAKTEGLKDDAWLLFVDADVRLHGDALWRAMAFARSHRHRAFSGSGIYPNPSFVGELLEGIMYTLLFLWMPLRRIHDPGEAVAWMNGQFVLIDRATYFEVGGHESVKGFSFDDLSFGHHLKKRGVPYRFLPAARLFECVNYVGLDEALLGWERLLAGVSPWMGLGKGFFGALALEITLMWLLPPVVAVLVYTGVAPDMRVAGVSLGAFALGQSLFVLIVHALTRLGMAIPVWRAVLHPLANALALLAVLRGYRARYQRRSFGFRGRELAPDQVPGT
jgi:GT2 family glycosyltransferase